MSNNLGLIELLFVFSAGALWGLYELRALRKDKKPPAAPPSAPRDPPA